MVEIDGSIGEGGGQILRTACSLSTATGRPCYVFNIRKMKKGGGLRAQHIAAIKGLKKLCQGEAEGLQIGSSKVIFEPGPIQGEEIEVSIKTAGSVTLVLHTLLPPAFLGDKETKITVKGGATDTFFAPTFNHFRYVFLNVIGKMGGKVEVDLDRRGFYPQGNALTKVTVHPSNLKSINLVNPGDLKEIKIMSGATEDLKDNNVAERQISGFNQLARKLNLPLNKDVTYYKTDSTGSHIDIIARMERGILGVNNLGKMNKSSETVGQEAAERFLKETSSQAPLDKHTADQLLPYMAISGKRCRIRTSEITDHCATNMKIVEKFYQGRFEAKGSTITWHP